MEQDLVAVRAIIISPDHKVLLGRRSRGTGASQWALLGGKPNPGETLESATIREVREESGLVLASLEPFLTTSDDKSVSDQNWTVHFFTATAEEKAEINEEHLEAKYFSVNELPTLDIAFNHRFVLSTYFANQAGV